MAYQVFWQVPDETLCVQLEGNLSLKDFNQINQTIVDYLGEETANREISLLVDLTRPCRVPQAFADLHSSQTYLLHPDLKHILVACTDKFNRLMMMLIFNLSRPSLRFFNDLDHALQCAHAVAPKHM